MCVCCAGIKRLNINRLFQKCVANKMVKALADVYGTTYLVGTPGDLLNCKTLYWFYSISVKHIFYYLNLYTPQISVELKYCKHSNREAMNRSWGNQKPNPALKTKNGK